MERSNVAKIVAAFAGGVIVALGSAFVYVRTSEVQHAPPVAQIAPPVAQVTAGTASDSAAPAVAPASVTPPAVDTAASEPVRRHRKKVRTESPRPSPAAAPEPADDVEQVAANTPAPAPPIASAPAAAPPQTAPRAVNEDQYQGPQPAAGVQPSPAAPASAPQPHVVTVPAGTSLFIRLGETLSSEHNYPGDTFRGTLDQPIILDGFIIADRGSKVLGQIATAERAGRVRGVAELNLNLTEINTTDGQQVRIVTDSFDKRGTTSKGTDAAKIAGGAALGAIIGALGGGGKGAAIGAGAGGAAGTGAVLATRGKAAIIPAETRMQFRLTSPVTITEKLNN